MRILIACEESQTLTKLFRQKGHEAFSNDIKVCTGGHPEWHIRKSVFDILDDNWDMMIGHPPCTYLTVTANGWLKDQKARKSGKLVGEARRNAKKSAEDFFMRLFDAKIPKICLENPVGSMNSIIPPTQIIQPYFSEIQIKKEPVYG